MVHTLCRRCLLTKLTRLLTPVRLKSKRHPQWYQYRRPTEPHEIAKEFFDDLYGKRFGKDWRSIRCAMLSRKKYAAIMNGFSKVASIEEKFIQNGAVDIVQQLRCNASLQLHNAKKNLENVICKIDDSRNDNCDDVRTTSNDQSLALEACQTSTSTETDEIHFAELEWLEKQCNIYSDLTQVCHGLRAYLYPQSDLTEFENPMGLRSSEHVIDYFLLDGSSVLPILALDPKPNDHVLDICAAPGGKLVCILQILRNGEGTAVANDVQSSRVSRLKKVRDEYIPKDSTTFQNLKIVSLDARRWEECESAVYDKVLADVPCTTDRYSMLPSFQHRENIFSQLRKRERGSLPQLQMDILRNAILSCRPGGIVVYSTCTASIQQNEFVVQMVVQEMLQNHGIVCEIEDLTLLTDLLQQHFHFYKDIELGTLVLPFLDANFGPTFVCKLSRTN